MVALLDDVSVLDDEDGVGVLNGGKTVRDYEAGSALHQPQHRLLDHYLGS